MIQYLTAEQQATQYYFKVWMDTAKTLEGTTEPDPTYIREYSWVLNPPEGQTTQQYLDSIKSEIAGLVTYELNQIQLQQQPQDPIQLAGF